jgi:hypothetical protein
MMSLGWVFSESFSDTHSRHPQGCFGCFSFRIRFRRSLYLTFPSESVSRRSFNIIFSYDVTGLLLSFRICFSHSLYTSHFRRHWAATLSESVSATCTRHSCRLHWAIIFQNLFLAASQHCKAASCSDIVFRRSLDFIFFVVTRLLFVQNPFPPSS